MTSSCSRWGALPAIQKEQDKGSHKEHSESNFSNAIYSTAYFQKPKYGRYCCKGNANNNPTKHRISYHNPILKAEYIILNFFQFLSSLLMEPI